MNTLRFMGVNKDTTTAGPGKRLEFFTKGCIRGVVNPCQGCFNESTWTFEGQFRGLSNKEVVDICLNDAWNRQVTFCGGEPILQGRALMDVARQLKEIDPSFHFVMYTAYKLDTLMKHGLKFTWLPKHGEGMKEHLESYSSESLAYSSSEGDETEDERILFTILTPEDVKELMTHIDLIVDGDYKMDQRLTTNTYMHEGWFIGSANQRVIFGPLSAKSEKLMYMPAKDYNDQRQSADLCKACGHELTVSDSSYCNKSCSDRYQLREEEMKLLGGV